MIEIIKKDGPHNRRVWKFYWENPFHIWLDEYRVEQRRPRARSWDVVKIYTRIGDVRRCPKDMLMAESDVPSTPRGNSVDIIDWIVKNTSINRWSNR